jgi:hypothetical protein
VGGTSVSSESWLNRAVMWVLRLDGGRALKWRGWVMSCMRTSVWVYSYKVPRFARLPFLETSYLIVLLTSKGYQNGQSQETD